MCTQLLLQVGMHLRDVLDGNKILGDILPDTVWLSQPCWQERLDLLQMQ